MSSYLAPAEIAEATVTTSQNKAGLPIPSLLSLGILAGVYVSFAGVAATMATQDITQFGIAKYVQSIIFGAALMMVIVAGAELFTGNTLIFMGVLQKRVTVGRMLRNWFWVYLANLLGSLLIVALMAGSGLYKVNGGAFACATIKTAYGKVTLTFLEAFIRGILCNWLVCLAVWMATSAKDIAGKILAIFFPISVFVISGFEHSVANMYYVPAGIAAMRFVSPETVAAITHLTPDKLSALNFGSFLSANLLPVTLGNIVGGALLVGGMYWFSFLRQGSKNPNR